MKLFTYIILTLFFTGCDGGLSPIALDKAKPVISGTIHFTGTMPSCDSVRTLAVVISKIAAPFAVSDILSQYGISIFVNTLIPCSFKDTSFSFTLDPGTYKYLGVVQQYDTNLLADWRIIGFLHNDNDSAESITLSNGEVKSDIDIRVRFDSSSRQPFIR